jgi:hypothetical protein
MRKPRDGAGDLDDGELVALMELERDLADRVGAAGRDAESLVQSARESAVRAEREAAAVIAEELARLRLRAEAELSSRVGELERESVARRERWAAVPGARIERAVRALVGEIVAELARESGS